MTIQEYLTTRPELQPWTVLEPEQCAECWHSTRECVVYVQPHEGAFIITDEDGETL